MTEEERKAETIERFNIAKGGFRRWHFRERGFPIHRFQRELDHAVQLLETWVVTINHGPPQQLIDLYLPDMPTVHPTFSKKDMLRTPEEIAEYFVPLQKRTGLSLELIDDCDIKVTGIGVATAQGFYNFSSIKNGSPQTINARFLIVWSRQIDGGGWRITNQQSDPIDMDPNSTFAYHAGKMLGISGSNISYAVRKTGSNIGHAVRKIKSRRTRASPPSPPGG